MTKRLFVAPSPHLHSGASTRRIMLDVILALMPALVVSVVMFGISALLVTLLAVLSCVASEHIISRYVAGEKSSVGDLSAVLTGVLLGFNLPSSIPWWIVVMGAVVAIGVAKMSFGGIGKNPFNPALVGRVFLLIAYPVQMTTFPQLESSVDIYSGATPLAALKMGGENFTISNVDLLGVATGNISGSLGEVAALALLLGGAYILWRKVISWHIPVAIFATMALFAAIYAFATGYNIMEVGEFSLFHIFAGGAVLGAVYMATDYSTSPMTHRGMLLYGVGVGVITMLIRLWGAYPEGMSFAILIMNGCVPLINKYLKPKRFGIVK